MIIPNQNFAKLDEPRYIPYLKSYAVELIHKQTKAKVLKIFSHNQLNTFAISFNTQASNDKGVPHVVEHCVLKGTRKYPVSDAFQLYKIQSIASFSNAFTSGHNTIYEFVSHIKADYFNFADILLDSTFHATFTEHTEIMGLEAYHKHIHAEPDGSLKLVHSGVVYNEMQDKLFDTQQVQRVTMNGGTYQYVHGGIPSEIRKIKFSELFEFYQRYYCPENCNVILFSETTYFEQELAMLHSYFTDAQFHGERHSLVKAINSSKILKVEGPHQFLGAGIILANLDTCSCQEYIFLLMLKPLIVQIIEGTRVFDMVDVSIAHELRNYQIMFCIKSEKSWTEDQMPHFQSIVKSVIECIIDNLKHNRQHIIHNELLNQAMFSAEEELRQKSNVHMYLLDYICESWLNGKPFDYFMNYTQTVSEYQEQPFLDRLKLLSVFAEKVFNKEITFGIVKQELNNSDEQLDKLDDEIFADLYQRCEHLHEFSLLRDSNEALRTIPYFNCEEHIDLHQMKNKYNGIKQYNGIDNIYSLQLDRNKYSIQIMYEVTDIFEESEYQLLQLAVKSFRQTLGNFNLDQGTEYSVELKIFPVKEGYKSFVVFKVEVKDSDFSLQCISTLLNLVHSYNNFSYQGIFQIIFTLMNEFKQRLSASYLSQSLFEDILFYKSLSQHSYAGTLLSLTSGFDFINFLQSTLPSIDIIFPVIVQMLMKTVQRGQMLIFVDSSTTKMESIINTVVECFLQRDIYYFDRVVDFSTYRHVDQFQALTKSVALDINVGASIKSYYQFPICAASLVAANILREELFQRIRVDGGAYDFSISFKNLNQLAITSKYDNQLIKTKEAFESLEAILNNVLVPAKFELHKRGAIVDLIQNAPLDFDFFLNQMFNGHKPDFIIDELMKIKNVTQDDIKTIADYFSFLSESDFIAFGPVAQIRALGVDYVEEKIK